MTDDYYQGSPGNVPVRTTQAEDKPDDAGDQQDLASQLSQESADSIVQKTTDMIIGDLGLEGANEEQKKAIVESISQRILTAVLKAVIANAPEDQTRPLVEKIANNTVSETDVEQIINNNPGLLEKVQDEIGLLYEKMLEESKDVLEKITSDTSEGQNIPVTSSKTAASPEDGIIDELKRTGKIVNQENIAKAVYEARSANKLGADITGLEGMSEEEKKQKLAEWDWNKAQEILALQKN